MMLRFFVGMVGTFLCFVEKISGETPVTFNVNNTGEVERNAGLHDMFRIVYLLPNNFSYLLTFSLSTFFIRFLLIVTSVVGNLVLKLLLLRERRLLVAPGFGNKQQRKKKSWSPVKTVFGFSLTMLLASLTLFALLPNKVADTRLFLFSASRNQWNQEISW